MIWLTWRQHRIEGLITLGVLAVLGVFLLMTGLDMYHAFQQSGLSACLALHPDRTVCGPLVNAFGRQFQSLIIVPGAPLFLPVVLGVLVGAPLVAREYEQRTHLLVWMQSITRSRWLTMKLILVLGAGAVAAGALLALMIWWYGPFSQLNGRFNPPAYDFEGPVLIGVTVMALALGIAAGTVTRRTIPAILLTLALILAIRWAVVIGGLRANFEPPILVTWPLAQGDNPPITLNYQDWRINDGYLDAHGNISNTLRCVSSSPQTPPNPVQCAQADGYRSFGLTYQPKDRFWTFQWIETGIYLAISALAIAATAFLVRRRLS
jgi:ABC-type transport system involved in multi-copper enzyme maturation permease subunit